MKCAELDTESYSGKETQTQVNGHASSKRETFVCLNGVACYGSDEEPKHLAAYTDRILVGATREWTFETQSGPKAHPRKNSHFTSDHLPLSLRIKFSPPEGWAQSYDWVEAWNVTPQVEEKKAKPRRKKKTKGSDVNGGIQEIEMTEWHRHKGKL